MNPELSISLPFLLGALKNNIGKMLLVLLVTGVLCALAINFLPRTYISEAIIFVRLGRESVSLDPTATTGSTVQVLESRESEVNSIRDMLSSRAILETVVDKMGPGVILGDEDLPEEFTGIKIRPQDDVIKSPRQQAIEMLIQEVYIITERKSTVIKLGVSASSPELARRIMEVYIDCYQAMHTSAHQTPEGNQFFENQSTVLRDQWETLMGELQESKKQAGVVSVEGAQDILKSQASETQMQFMKVKSARSAATAKLEGLRELSKNPVNVRGLRQDLLETKASLVSMDAELKAVEANMAELQELAQKLNRDEVKIRQLEQEVAVAGANYTQYRELHEQTRIEAALLSSKFTNVKVIQEPSFIPRAVGPKKKVIVAGGIVAGFSGAALIAVLCEIFFGGRPPLTPATTGVGNPSNPGFRESHELIQNANA